MKMKYNYYRIFKRSDLTDQEMYCVNFKIEKININER